MATTQQTFVLVGPFAGKTLPINGHEFVDGKMTYIGSAAQVEVLARILADYGVVKEGEAPRNSAEAADMSLEELKDPARSTPDYTDGRKISDAVGGAVGGAIDDLVTDRQDRLVDGGVIVAAVATTKPSGELQEIVHSADGERLVLTEPTTSTTAPQETPQTPAEQIKSAEVDAGIGNDQAAKQSEADSAAALEKALAGDVTDANATPAPASSVVDETAKPTLEEALAQLDPEDATSWTSNNLPSVEKLSTLTGTKVTRENVNGLADGYTRAKARAARS